MGQYQVASTIYDADTPCTARELARQLGLERATVHDYLRVLRRKGYLERTADGHIPAPDRTKEDLEQIRPPKLQDLMSTSHD